MKKTLLLAASAILLAGCGQPSGQAPSSGSAGGSSVINTMTQKDKVDAGRRTADKVRAISAQQSENLKEVGGE